MNVVEFLKARISEDEKEAQDYQQYEDQISETAGWWDPSRVLAECAAKRSIIEDWEDPDSPGVWQGYDAGSAIAVDRAARALALVYSDHADFDPKWRES